MNQEPNHSQQNEQGQQQSFYYQPGYYPPPIADPKGDAAQTLGIVALVCLFFCQIVSIVCGALAIRRARESRDLLRCETQGAKVGRICGILSLVFGILSVIAVILYVLFIMIVVMLSMMP